MAKKKAKKTDPQKKKTTRKAATATRTTRTTRRTTKKKKSVRKAAPTRDAIAKRAYEIWLESGCAANRDEANWKQAERELTGA